MQVKPNILGGVHSPNNIFMGCSFDGISKQYP